MGKTHCLFDHADVSRCRVSIAQPVQKIFTQTSNSYSISVGNLVLDSLRTRPEHCLIGEKSTKIKPRDGTYVAGFHCRSVFKGTGSQ